MYRLASLDALLARQQDRHGHAVFSEGERQLDHRQLFAVAGRIAHALQAHGVRPGDRVAILLPRGIDAACGIYGALLAGACYVPLDPQNPATRLSYIAEDVAPRCLLGRGTRPAWCPDAAVWVDIDSLATPGAPFTPVPHASPEALAAILYTSGSTGNPKGVCISCRAVDAFVTWAIGSFDIGETDRIASLAPFHFDLSLFDLFATVASGACVHFVPPALTLAPSKLVAWLEAQGITAWYTVPSILGFLCQRGGLSPERLPAMRTLLFAGEVFPLAGLRKLVAALPHVAFHNLFGPTETNVCTWWPVDRERLETLDALPIGDAACGAALRIDASGELLVSGPCLMQGYWREGRLQAAQGVWHHTGDRVSRNDKGELLYHGRIDRMIKVSGYRIEPAEIEAAINRYAQLDGAVVVGEPDPIGGQRLVAVVAGEGADINGLRIHLKQHLASYMQPYRFVQLQALPRLSNGKVDYRAVATLI